MVSLLLSRDVTGDIKDTLSSWDKCMAKSYCKWPVIAVIIIGSLIVLSLLVCLGRCICCGAECACCCFRCCAGCCGSGRKGHKRMASAQAPPPAPIYPPDTPYRSHAPPIFIQPHTTPSYAPLAHPATTFTSAQGPERAQYAQFDVENKSFNEDSLPAMPEWKDATSKHIEVEEHAVPEKPGDMEMNHLPNGGGTPTAFATTVGVSGRSMARSPGPRSPPQHGYGYGGGYQQNHSLIGGAPYGQQQEDHQGLPLVHSLTTPDSTAIPYGQYQEYGRSSPRPLNTQLNGQLQNHSPISPIGNQSYGPPLARNIVEMPSPRIPQNVSPIDDPPPRSHSPGYALSGTTAFEPSRSPAPAYPGQFTYPEQQSQPTEQQRYRAFSPAQEQDSGSWPLSAPQRKPVNGSWKEV
ncbi:hypothetical protein GQ43DRAFT_483883 [Delitschia confertaspora ATCC 74209]|uniref:Uncharacterized protein n=1 Tax=Delitschia confertaspora ATCC 74209 TaxID=1513339 RepID=A0A9P4JEN9_9PLEO|nr:hypothetical protein GQ43DRAFT_483883 [Delitschia confertaspora ATCC 74209]